MTPWTIQPLEFSRPGYWSGQPFPSLGDLAGSQVFRNAGWSLSAKPQGKLKNTGVGSLSLLQGIFPTQGLNPGLLHCRRILYRLSHQRSPIRRGQGHRHIPQWQDCRSHTCGAAVLVKTSRVELGVFSQLGEERDGGASGPNEGCWALGLWRQKGNGVLPGASRFMLQGGAGGPRPKARPSRCQHRRGPLCKPAPVHTISPILPRETGSGVTQVCRLRFYNPRYLLSRTR